MIPEHAGRPVEELRQQLLRSRPRHCLSCGKGLLHPSPAHPNYACPTCGRVVILFDGFDDPAWF